MIHKELKRKGVTLFLLWEEYKEVYSEGYGYTQFCEHYSRFKKSQELCQISAILSTNHQQLIERLGALDVILSSVASHVAEFTGLARTLHPQISISEQAISILRQLVSSGAKLFMEHKVMSGKPHEYRLIDGGHGTIICQEPQFMEDDLNTLLELGFLRLEFGSRGSRQFYVTRQAVRLLKEIDR